MSVEELIPKHGGYRRLKSFQIAQFVYDITVRFCDHYVDKCSRTRDQMVQAARSGVQNIAEGSIASGTSKKTELKLTNVARASLEELRLDYEDFLRQRGMELWRPDHPVLRRFKERRCATLEDLRAWVREGKKSMDLQGNTDEHRRTRTNTDEHRRTRTDTDMKGKSVLVCEGPCKSVPVLIANAALSLLNLCCYFLDRQLNAQERAFVSEGGFTERLYKVRSQSRRAFRNL